MPGVGSTIKEFKAGTLRSGSRKGPVVKDRKQAVAIGLNNQRKEQGKRMAKMVGKAPPPPSMTGGGQLGQSGMAATIGTMA